MATQPKSQGPEAPALPRSADRVELPPLAFFACPNPDCPFFNVFGAGNLSVAEHLGKSKAIRRLYCNVCHGRFRERQGSLLEDSKLPPPDTADFEAQRSAARCAVDLPRCLQLDQDPWFFARPYAGDGTGPQ